MGFLILTDLDGTLLNHHDYCWDGARAALAAIGRRSIPLVLTTSKTRAELLPLRGVLANTWPFITENGGGIFFPRDSWPPPVPGGEEEDEFFVLSTGRRYEELRRIFYRLQKKFPIRGFGDMSVEEICYRTGLEPPEAVLAAQREFSEPFTLDQPGREAELRRAASEDGCDIVRGGRFYHLIGKSQDKGRSATLIIERFRERFGDLITIGLGDSANDLPLLERVDIPVLIPHPNGRFEPCDLPGLVRAPHPGSRGWGEAVMQILEAHGPAPPPSRGETAHG